ncbi:MAG: TIGR04211 family SH3 domain-containing protein [Thermodesulfobacteriota bacterium]
MLIITMRSGAGDEYKVIRTLRTDTPVEVLDAKGNFFRVKTKDGQEGWVLKQYLSPDIPKATVIARLKAEITRLKGRMDKLAGERDALARGLKAEKGLRGKDVGRLEKALSEKSARITSLTRQLKEMTGKYKRLVADSGDVVKIVKERDALKKDNARLFLENNELTKENDRLNRRSMVYWFLAGGGVFFIGWAAGRLSRKKRSQFYMF